MKPGDKVRIRANPSRIGILTNEYDGPPSRRRVLVRFFDGDEEFILEGSLEKVTGDPNRPYALIEGGRYGNANHLRGSITYYRLSGRLANLIYSLNTTNTQFFAYQFKPVLQFLDSPCQGILIADEVGLGKTIEAGLIWTELRARLDARRLLVVCPAMLREKWRDELGNRFGIKADICDAGELLGLLERSGSSVHEEFAYIASLQGIRPPRGWDEEAKQVNTAAKLAAFFEKKAFDDPLFDMVIIDEAHYLRNPSTQTHKLGRLLRPICESLVMLSATPIQLRSDDLFYLLNLLDEDAFPYSYSFTEILEANAPIVHLRDQLLRESVPQDDFVSALHETVCNRIFQGNQQINHLISNPPAQSELNGYQGRSLLAEKLDRVNPLTKVIARSRKRDVQERRVVRCPVAVKAEMTPVEAEFYSAVTDGVCDFCEDMDISTGFMLTIPQRQMASCMAAACRAWHEKADTTNKRTALEETFYEAFGGEDDEVPDKSENTLGTLLTVLVNITREIGDFKALKRNDSKYARLLQSLKNYWMENPRRKVILFSFYRETLRYLNERLREDGIPSIVVMGGMDKHAAIEAFTKPSGPDILLSSEVAAEGVDLQFSSLLINYDLPWNPMRIEQRIGRIDRIGQEAERILIWNFLYADSIDDRIYERLLTRLNIFEQALGSIEAMLGEKIRELGYFLLVHKLSEAEEAARIEQTALAIETLNRTQESLEKEASHLIAHGEYILNQVRAAREIGRYVTGQDLSRYVRDFFIQVYEGSRFIRKDDEGECYSVELSIDAKMRLREFLDSYHLQGRTRILREANPVVLFENQVGFKKYGVEIISQYHPLIRFVSEELRAKGKAGGYFPVSAIEVSRLEIPDLNAGTYVYAVARWSVSGARDIERLEYSVVRFDTSQWLDNVAAERLVNIAAMHGRDWDGAKGILDHRKVAEMYDFCLKSLEEKFKFFEGDIQRENNDRISLMINTLERHRNSQRNKILERISSHRQSGEKRKIKLIPAEEGKLKKLNMKIDERIAMLRKKQVIESSEGTVSGGVIRLY
jgi:SNF2 family DNA or RNA helicase